MRSISLKCLPPTCPRTNVRGRYIILRRKANAKHFFKMPSSDLPSNECEGALHYI